MSETAAADTRTSGNAPLFYANPQALARDIHRDLRTRAEEANYAFARGSHFIPALIDEFSPASRDLPIVFVPGSGAPTPVFVVGLETGRNVLVDEDGAWKGGYVPAYLRRYPFILGEAEGRDPILMIDGDSDRLSREDGAPLFDGEGESTQTLERIIAFANDYYAAGKRTERFVEILKEFDLFRAVSVDATASNGSRQTIHGLLAIDEDKLYTMDETRFLRLREERLFAAIFAHFFSLSQFDKLKG